MYIHMCMNSWLAISIFKPTFHHTQKIIKKPQLAYVFEKKKMKKKNFFLKSPAPLTYLITLGKKATPPFPPLKLCRFKLGASKSFLKYIYNIPRRINLFKEMS